MMPDDLHASAHETRLAVVGASAGGVEALQRFASGLPEELAFPVVVVIHTPAAGASVLPQILQRRTSLPCGLVRDGQLLAPGLHVAPADHHLLLDAEGRVTLNREPRENGLRPAIDRTLGSLADSLGVAGAGIILSGTRDDGVAGLRRLQRAGGRVGVQDPADALFPGMPMNALDVVAPDAVLSALELGRWVAEPRTEVPAPPPDEPLPAVTRDEDHAAGIGTRLTCPDCGGVLFEQPDGPATHFTCSVGHSYTPGVLAMANGNDVDRAMWVAARMLGDRATFLDGLARRAQAAGRAHSGRLFALQARDAREQHELLVAVLEREPAGEPIDHPDTETDAA